MVCLNLQLLASPWKVRDLKSFYFQKVLSSKYSSQLQTSIVLYITWPGKSAVSRLLEHSGYKNFFAFEVPLGGPGLGNLRHGHCVSPTVAYCLGPLYSLSLVQIMILVPSLVS